MLLQFEFLGESLPADLTLVRQVVRMSMHMEFEVGHFVERSLAFRTFERFFTGMNHDMIPKVPLLVESFATNVAKEGFIVTVCTYMGLQSRRSVEAFAANIALVWLLLCVDYLMPA